MNATNRDAGEGAASRVAAITVPPAGGAKGSNPPRPSTNGFVAAFGPDGTSLLYATYLGGTGHDGGTGIALDAAGPSVLPKRIRTSILRNHPVTRPTERMTSNAATCLGLAAAWRPLATVIRRLTVRAGARRANEPAVVTFYW